MSLASADYHGGGSMRRRSIHRGSGERGGVAFGGTPTLFERNALEKRRKLKDAWSAYCEPETSATIVRLSENGQLDQRMQSIDRGLAALDRNK